MEIGKTWQTYFDQVIFDIPFIKIVSDVFANGI